MMVSFCTAVKAITNAAQSLTLGYGSAVGWKELTQSLEWQDYVTQLACV